MGFVALKCPSCGADIQLDESLEFGFCSYCGTRVIQEKVVVEHKGSVTIEGVPNAQSLLKRAKIFISDGQFTDALKYIDKVLDIEPENGTAYLCKLMAEYKIREFSDLGNATVPLQESISYKNAIRFCNGKIRESLSFYNEQSIKNCNILQEKIKEEEQRNRKAAIEKIKKNKVLKFSTPIKLVAGLAMLISAFYFVYLLIYLFHGGTIINANIVIVSINFLLILVSGILVLGQIHSIKKAKENIKYKPLYFSYLFFFASILTYVIICFIGV